MPSKLEELKLQCTERLDVLREKFSARLENKENETENLQQRFTPSYHKALQEDFAEVMSERIQNINTATNKIENANTFDDITNALENLLEFNTSPKMGLDYKPHKSDELTAALTELLTLTEKMMPRPNKGPPTPKPY